MSPSRGGAPGLPPIRGRPGALLWRSGFAAACPLYSEGSGGAAVQVPRGPVQAAGPVAVKPQTRRGQLRMAGLLHPFRWGAAAPVIDTPALARQLAGPLGMAALESRVAGNARAHQLSLDRIGPHRIAAWVGSALAITGAAQPIPTLYLLRGGWLEWLHPGPGSCQVQRLEPGWLLYLNSPGYRLRSGVCSVVAIALDPARLELQLANLAVAGLDTETCRQLLAQSLLGGPGAGPLGSLVEAIGSLLQLYERLVLTDPRLVVRLELDRLLERLVAALLLTAAGGLESLDLTGTGAASLPPRDQAFEALLARIRAHLGESLDLATLEAWAQRSRRELQVVFRDRLGCTPMQWVRRERLQQARRRLEQPEPGDTVASIARASGYSSASHFSSDFRSQFQVTPTQIMQARKNPTS